MRTQNLQFHFFTSRSVTNLHWVLFRR